MCLLRQRRPLPTGLAAALRRLFRKLRDWPRVCVCVCALVTEPTPHRAGRVASDLWNSTAWQKPHAVCRQHCTTVVNGAKMSVRRKSRPSFVLSGDSQKTKRERERERDSQLLQLQLLSPVIRSQDFFSPTMKDVGGERGARERERKRRLSFCIQIRCTRNPRVNVCHFAPDGLLVLSCLSVIRLRTFVCSLSLWPADRQHCLSFADSSKFKFSLAES